VSVPETPSPVVFRHLCLSPEKCSISYFHIHLKWLLIRFGVNIKTKLSPKCEDLHHSDSIAATEVVSLSFSAGLISSPLVAGLLDLELE
jgi:hypothetical protein